MPRFVRGIQGPDVSFPARPPWTPRPSRTVAGGGTADLEDNLPSLDCPVPSWPRLWGGGRGTGRSGGNSSFAQLPCTELAKAIAGGTESGVIFRVPGVWRVPLDGADAALSPVAGAWRGRARPPCPPPPRRPGPP